MSPALQCAMCPVHLILDLMAQINIGEEYSSQSLLCILLLLELGIQSYFLQILNIRSFKVFTTVLMKIHSFKSSVICHCVDWHVGSSLHDIVSSDTGIFNLRMFTLLYKIPPR